ncbi:MAG TPA: hypothetical protein VF498_13305 [Anaerolineales bacterium]
MKVLAPFKGSHRIQYKPRLLSQQAPQGWSGTGLLEQALDALVIGCAAARHFGRKIRQA